MHLHIKNAKHHLDYSTNTLETSIYTALFCIKPLCYTFVEQNRSTMAQAASVEVEGEVSGPSPTW